MGEAGLSSAMLCVDEKANEQTNRRMTITIFALECFIIPPIYSG